MTERHAGIHDQTISEAERKFRWPLGRRHDGHSGLTAMGL
jgi:nuclear transport factor 2 (NTF2) superfamily protein